MTLSKYSSKEEILTQVPGKENFHKLLQEKLDDEDWLKQNMMRLVNEEYRQK